jgi:hypothetical protein
MEHIKSKALDDTLNRFFYGFFAVGITGPFGRYNGAIWSV